MGAKNTRFGPEGRAFRPQAAPSEWSMKPPRGGTGWCDCLFSVLLDSPLEKWVFNARHVLVKEWDMLVAFPISISW